MYNQLIKSIRFTHDLSARYYCKQCLWKLEYKDDFEKESIKQLIELEGHSHYCACMQVFKRSECICGDEINNLQDNEYIFKLLNNYQDNI